MEMRVASYVGAIGGDPTEAAEDYAAYHNPHWKHPKHGIDDRIAWCRECDLQTLAPAGPDLQDQIDKAVESWPPPDGDEPIGWGDLGDLYICFGCAEPVSESDLANCSYCGELAPRDDDYSQCPACNHPQFG